MFSKRKMKYQICVSGASRGETVERDASIAYEVGKAITRADCVLMTGATVGIPDHAARGCKDAGGQSIGISPAATRLEHIKKYNLPIEHYDYILYTGQHYIGRDALMISSSDAVVTMGGRIGTLHEFTIALELEKPIGIIKHSGGTSDWFDELMTAAGIKDYAERNVIFDNDPARLVKSIVAILDTLEGKEPKNQEFSIRKL